MSEKKKNEKEKGEKEMKKITGPVKYFLPLILFAAIVVTYILAQAVFINCSGFNICTPIDGSLISRIMPDTEVVPLNEATEGLINTKERKFAEVKAANPTPVAPAVTPPAGAIDAASLAAAAVAAANAAANAAAAAETDAAKKKVVYARAQIAQRYSQRLLFMFLAGATILLSIAAIIFSWKLIDKSLITAGFESWSWLAFTGTISIILIVPLAYASKKANPIVEPMFEKTLFTNGDTNLYAIHLINCVGFFATMWLASAACALFYSAFSLADETPDPEAVYLTIVKKFRDNITWLLYICALMLCVGMLRVKVVTDWHLKFLSNEVADPFYKLLSDFFSTLFSVQAAFYSLMLLILYLPVKYAVDYLKEKKNVAEPGANATAGQPNPLQRLGIPVTGDMLAKLLAVLGPLFTGPVVDFINFLLGKAAS